MTHSLDALEPAIPPDVFTRLLLSRQSRRLWVLDLLSTRTGSLLRGLAWPCPVLLPSQVTQNLDAARSTHSWCNVLRITASADRVLTLCQAWFMLITCITSFDPWNHTIGFYHYLHVPAEKKESLQSLTAPEITVSKWQDHGLWSDILTTRPGYLPVLLPYHSPPRICNPSGLLAQISRP